MAWPGFDTGPFQPLCYCPGGAGDEVRGWGNASFLLTAAHSRPCGLIWAKELGSILGTQRLSPVRPEAKTATSSPLFPHRHLLCFSEEEKHKQTKQLNLLLTPAAISGGAQQSEYPSIPPPLLPREPQTAASLLPSPSPHTPEPAGIPPGVFKPLLCCYYMVISLEFWGGRAHPRGFTGPLLLSEMGPPLPIVVF